MVVSTAASMTEQTWTTAVLAAPIQSGFLAFLPHSRKLSNQVMSWRAFGLERTPFGPTIARTTLRVLANRPGLPVFGGVSL